MYENGYISFEIAQKFISSDLITELGKLPTKKDFTLLKKNSYFTDAIKGTILRKYNKEVLETNGLSIRATLQPEVQLVAKEALQNELINFDQNLKTFRGPIGRIPIHILRSEDSILTSLSELDIVVPVEDWFVAVVSKVYHTYADVLLCLLYTSPSPRD